MTAVVRGARRRGVAGLFAASDALLVTGLALAGALAGGPTGPGRLAAAGVLAGGLVGGLHLTGVYARSRRRITPLPGDDVATVAGGLLLGAVTLTALQALAPGALSGLFRPATPLVVAALALAALPLGRAAALALTRGGRRRTRVLVLGTGHMAREIATRLARSGQVTVVGHVDDEPAPGVEHGPMLGTLASLRRLCEELAVDRVVVAFSRSHPARAAEMLRSLPGHVAVDVVPRYFEITGWQSTLDDVSGLTLLSLGDRVPSRGARALKRAVDLAVAVTVLTAAFPLLALATLAIQLESPGPLLFRQERLGRNRTAFRIAKLRTMIPLSNDASAAPARPRLPGAHENDPRITRVARLVRRLGIDELPQLVNVLRGEMSLVGPRPLVPEECAAMEAWTNHRFDVRPGLTGLWQVCGQHALSFDELCRLDYQYATSWSVATDLRILVRTPARLLRGGGGAAPEVTATRPAASAPTERVGDRLAEPVLLALPAGHLHGSRPIRGTEQLVTARRHRLEASGD